MRVFDLHCDTAYRLYREALPFSSPLLHISQTTLCCFNRVCQVFAFWSDKRDTDREAWLRFLQTYSHFRSILLPSHLTCLLAIEDLRLIDGDIGRIATLKHMGFGIMGLFWSGDNALGSAHNSPQDRGLTDFGRKAVEQCFQLDITVDVSHASQKSTDQIIQMAEKQNKIVIASHSNFAECTNHTRNIQTHHAKRIQSLGGVIGLSFVPDHLGGNDIACFARHVEFAAKNGFGNCICLGSDFDGTDELPQGVMSQRDLPYVNQCLKDFGIARKDRYALFWHNGNAFVKRAGLIPSPCRRPTMHHIF